MTEWVVVGVAPKLPGPCMICGQPVTIGPYAFKKGVWDAIWHANCALNGTISHESAEVPLRKSESVPKAFNEGYDALMDVFSILSDTLKETNLILKGIEKTIRGQGP